MESTDLNQRTEANRFVDIDIPAKNGSQPEAQVAAGTSFGDDRAPQVDLDPQLPEGVTIPFQEALEASEHEMWNACAAMCRRALSEAMEQVGANGKNLIEQLSDCSDQGLLTKALRDWSTELAINLKSEPMADSTWAAEGDAKELVEFCNWIFKYLYILPAELQAQRGQVSRASNRDGASKAERAASPREYSGYDVPSP